MKTIDMMRIRNLILMISLVLFCLNMLNPDPINTYYQCEQKPTYYIGAGYILGIIFIILLEAALFKIGETKNETT